MSVKTIGQAFLFVAGCELAGVVGSFFTTPYISSWYAPLAKPTFAPPNWVFGPVWTALFALMGIAAFLVWQKGWVSSRVRLGLILFALQLCLNVLWSFLFFGQQNPGAAFVELVFFWLAIAATLVAFSRVSHVAALLLVPYLAWVSFAGYLNYSIWVLNSNTVDAPVVRTKDYKNIAYDIDGERFTLVKGVATVAAGDNSESKTTVRYFGNSVQADFNGDGKKDIAFIMTKDTGGSGTFFYIVAALKTENSYHGTNAILLGDRIAPQSTELFGKQIIVNYADRKPEEAMTARPLVGWSRYFEIVDGKLIELSIAT